MPQTMLSNRPGPRVDPRPRLVESLRGIAKRFRQQARRMRGDERRYARAAAAECELWAGEVATKEREERLQDAAANGSPLGSSRLGA